MGWFGDANKGWGKNPFPTSRGSGKARLRGNNGNRPAWRRFRRPKKVPGESSGSTYSSVQFFVHLFLGEISGKYFSLISEKIFLVTFALKKIISNSKLQMILDEGTLTHKTLWRAAMILFCLIKPGFLKKVFFRNLPFFRTAYPKSSPWPELKPLFWPGGGPLNRKPILYPTVTIQGKGGSLGGEPWRRKTHIFEIMIYGHFPKRYSKNKKTKWTFECRWHVFSFSFSSGDPIRMYQTSDSGKRHFGK